MRFPLRAVSRRLAGFLSRAFPLWIISRRSGRGSGRFPGVPSMLDPPGEAARPALTHITGPTGSVFGCTARCSLGSIFVSRGFHQDLNQRHHPCRLKEDLRSCMNLYYDGWQWSDLPTGVAKLLGCLGPAAKIWSAKAAMAGVDRRTHPRATRSVGVAH